MPDPDDLASTLAEIRERRTKAVAYFDGFGLPEIVPGLDALWESAADVPALLAAVGAALKLADDWDAESDRLDDVADNPGCDEEARPVLSGEAQGYSDCAAALREAITAALTGKEAGDGG